MQDLNSYSKDNSGTLNYLSYINSNDLSLSANHSFSLAANHSVILTTAHSLTRAKCTHHTTTQYPPISDSQYRLHSHCLSHAALSYSLSDATAALSLNLVRDCLSISHATVTPLNHAG